MTSHRHLCRRRRAADNFVAIRANLVAPGLSTRLSVVTRVRFPTSLSDQSHSLYTNVAAVTRRAGPYRSFAEQFLRSSATPSWQGHCSARSSPLLRGRRRFGQRQSFGLHRSSRCGRHADRGSRGSLPSQRARSCCCWRRIPPAPGSRRQTTRARRRHRRPPGACLSTLTPIRRRVTRSPSSCCRCRPRDAAKPITRRSAAWRSKPRCRSPPILPGLPGHHGARFPRFLPIGVPFICRSSAVPTER